MAKREFIKDFYGRVQGEVGSGDQLNSLLSFHQKK